MREFFLDEKIVNPFKIFGITHFICILIVILGMVLIYRHSSKIKKIVNKLRLKHIMFIILFSNMAIYYGSYIYYGVYDWRVHLPLHICFIAGILFMIYLINGNPKIYKVSFFMSFIGPLPALIYPNLTSGLDYFVFYQYFISHHLLILFNYFVFYLDDFHIVKKDAIKAFFTCNLIFIIMAIFNTLFNTNYIMSGSLPDFILVMYPFLKGIPSFIVLELTGTVVLILIYNLVYLKNRNDKKIHEIGKTSKKAY